MWQDFSDKQCFLSTEKLKMLHDADARKSQQISINWIVCAFPMHCSCRMHTLYLYDFHDASADGMLFFPFLVEHMNLSSNVWCLKASTIINQKSMMAGDVKNTVPVSTFLEWFMISVQTLFNFIFSDVVKLGDTCIALIWNVVLFLSSACKEVTVLNLNYLCVMSYSTVTLASASLEKPEFKHLALGYPADRPMKLRSSVLNYYTTHHQSPSETYQQEETRTITSSTSVNCSNWKQVPYCPVKPWLSRQN